MRPVVAVWALASIFAASRAYSQQPVPDAPAPQPAPSLSGASGVSGPITPGIGSNPDLSDGATSPAASTAPSSSSSAPAAQQPPATPDNFQQAPDLPAAGQGLDALKPLQVNVNFVVVPVTVKDTKSKLVPGLTWRDFRVFENGQRQNIRLFSSDATPISMAFVIDQSLTSDVMARVNDSLNSIQGALTPYDEIAVFSYSHGSQERTGFTGAQSARVNAVLALTKSAGTEELVPEGGGPFVGCSATVNGACADPNIQVGKSTGSGYFVTIPKEIHTLNDAILAAAKELSTRPKERRRVIYVVSDGKEQGSKATYKDVLRYLETNNISVWGTLVGDSARWGEGYLSKFHIPGMMMDNRLTAYVIATGGALDSERGVNGMENSYARLAEEARTQYTLGYYSHENILDDKFRKIEVRVERPSLEVYAKDGYYPSAQTVR